MDPASWVLLSEDFICLFTFPFVFISIQYIFEMYFTCALSPTRHSILPEKNIEVQYFLSPGTSSAHFCLPFSLPFSMNESLQSMNGSPWCWTLSSSMNGRLRHCFVNDGTAIAMSSQCVSLYHPSAPSHTVFVCRDLWPWSHSTTWGRRGIHYKCLVIFGGWL